MLTPDSPTQDRGVHESHPDLEGGDPAPWNPRHIGWLTLLLSPVPAAVLHALNWRRLGDATQVRPQMVKNLGAAVLFCAAAWFDALNRFWLLVLYFGFAGYFVTTQIPAFNSAIRAGRRLAGFLKPALYSAGAIAGLFALLIGGALLEDYLATSRLDRMLQNGEYDLYAAEMQHWIEDDPSDPAAHWNLALLYNDLEEWQQVATHLRLYVGMRPDDTEAVAWLAAVEEDLGPPTQPNAEAAR